MPNRIRRIALYTALVALLFAVCPSARLFSAQGLAKKQSEFFDELSRHFAQWDTDHDGELSSAEIDSLIVNPKITGKDAAVAVVLKRIQNKDKWQLPSLTGQALQGFAQTAPGANSALPDFGMLYGLALRHVEKADRDLFGGIMPSLATLHQGRLGDCFFLAPLGALVNRNGQAIREMISVHADGSYEVKFGSGRSVTIPKLTDAEIALTSSDGKGGLWLNVMENAYATVRNELRPEDKQVEESIDAIAHGGTSGPVIRLFTGHDIIHIAAHPKVPAGSNPSDEQLEQHLAKLRATIGSAIADHRLICVGSPKQTSTPGITPSHCYAILNLDPRTDNVEIWNPHGNHFKPKGSPGLETGYVTDGGRFTVPLIDFTKIFTGIHCEAPAKP
ncbi:MAG TPA: C2 family cysteine protease [Pirellulales bacterium]|jgi:hypothetical protein